MAHSSQISIVPSWQSFRAYGAVRGIRPCKFGITRSWTGFRGPGPHRSVLARRLPCRPVFLKTWCRAAGLLNPPWSMRDRILPCWLGRRVIRRPFGFPPVPAAQRLDTCSSRQRRMALSHAEELVHGLGLRMTALRAGTLPTSIPPHPFNNDCELARHSFVSFFIGILP